MSPHNWKVSEPFHVCSVWTSSWGSFTLNESENVTESHRRGPKVKKNFAFIFVFSQCEWALRLEDGGSLRLAVLLRAGGGGGGGLWKADSMLQTAGRLGTQPQVRPPFVPYLPTSPKYRDTLRPSCQSLSSVHWHSNCAKEEIAPQAICYASKVEIYRSRVWLI